MATTTTFLCDCCLTVYVRRLRDCCTSTDVDLAVPEGVGGSVTVLYDGKCYTTSASTTLRDDAVTNGWSILGSSDFAITSGCFDQDNCLEYYIALLPLCGSPPNPPEIGNYWLGPFSPHRAIFDSNGYVQIGGDWYSAETADAYQKGCTGDGRPTTDIIGSESDLDTWTLTQPSICCNRCVVSGTFPDEILSYDVIPCCIQITGFSFSGCGTPTGTTWDGKLFSNRIFGGYSPSTAGSPGDTETDCGGNWASSNGFVPGTTRTLNTFSTVGWDCDAGNWYIDLGYGDMVYTGGTDPTDPTGTYTYSGGGSPGCSGPTTLTVSAI